MNFRIRDSLLIPVLVSSALAATTGTIGVLFPANSVYLNGMDTVKYGPITVGDVIRTRERGLATLQFRHSVALIPPDSVVRIDSKFLVVDTGTVSLRTGEEVMGITADVKTDIDDSLNLRVQARDFRIGPFSKHETTLEVTRSNGLIAVRAVKNAVSITCGARALRIEEGHQISGMDKPGCVFMSQ